MNNHGTAYLVIRSIVRTLVALLFVFAVVIGIPVAAQLVWPALVISAILFLIVWLLHRRDQKRVATDAS